ncbi:hypothetical protein J2S43_002362 [Catenuloplanes nepalensis]|uniref:PA14 domain-containing protein n=1 Tax=Catenuloplanes nepalensis TaxID=587533 RepID=A0ABT9MQZ1_9ACTN|nr:neuraminidase-like domain-containing protein [Catenuloplanes nepalensis]MDP9793850.1 hypothetical protein [Catenuloplanes nepalensis]
MNTMDPERSGDDQRYEVDGRVTSLTSAALGGLRVVVVDKRVGGDESLSTATTDARGAFTASFRQEDLEKHGKIEPDIQVRIQLGQRLLTTSEVRYNAGRHETFLILLDETATGQLRSEHETLTGAISAFFDGDLSTLQETDTRQDVTYLANKSGWDARAVALASLAAQFSAGATDLARRDAGPDTDATGLAAPLFYALFRSGVPANPAALYRTPPKTVEAIWKRAAGEGVIPSGLADTIPAAVTQFQKVAAAQLLDSGPVAGVSSLKDLLTATLPADTQRRTFTELYVRFGDDPARLWTEVQGKLGEATTRRLRVNGQLSYLTLNNASLIARLHNTVGGGIANPSQLAAAGFHKEAKWRQTLASDPLPPEIPGGNDAEKRDNYAALLAAQVRLSFPTAVVGQMIAAGETPIAGQDARTKVRAFLAEQDGRFEIGMQPIDQFVARAGLTVDPAVPREIGRIQRVYQITPDDAAMNGLLGAGVDSAAAVVRYDRAEFVRAFTGPAGGAERAGAIHDKAAQVHGAVVNVALAFLAARTAPGIGVHSPASIIAPSPQPPAHAADVLAYGALEQLFGEMDYCPCDHCRSVLSPAAYLVDLLLFADRPAGEIPAGFSNPQTVLLERRPDLANTPLTCENTTTPLPYIDVVNETLEHYVTNAHSLAGYTGHDTGDRVPPEELLASPQYVTEAAYTVLAGESFPPPLPFHQPLESLRRFFARFDAPLPAVMAALRRTDDLDPAGTDYGWRDIRLETLGMSRAEQRLLTERAADVMSTVKRLYGFDPATPDADVRATLDNARTFCRRTGITYTELTDILRTRFVNPGSHLVPRLERLGVPFSTLAALKAGTITDDRFLAMLSPKLDPAQYGGDVVAWVKNDINFRRIMGILTLVDPVHPQGSGSFDTVELRYADPAPAASRLRAFEFVRLMRFIRLWRALGWSIARTDTAITALYPAAQLPDQPAEAVNLERLDAGMRVLLPALGVVREAMDTLRLEATGLPSLLALAGRIDTHGEDSLYRRLFLAPSTLDAAFAEDGFGGYLVDPNARLLDHAGALRSAFALSATEFAEISDALGHTAGTALTIDTVTAVFRRAWLSRRLRLSARELNLLIRCTGHDPFGPPDPVRPGLLRLTELLARTRDRGLTPAQVLYLFWNEDLSRRSAPTADELATVARTLRAAFDAVEAEYTRVDDPDGTIARAQMALAYGTEATDLFFGLLDRTLVSSAAYHQDAPELAAAVLAAAPGQIGYDAFRKLLLCRGVLTTAVRDALKGAAGVSTAFRTAVDVLFAQSQAVVAPFFARYPELRPLHDAYLASTDPIERRRTVLLEAFLPDLKRWRKRQQALLTAGAAAGTDPGTATAVLDDPAALHAAGDPARPATDDLTAAETRGLTTRIFHAATATGNPAVVRPAETNLDYAPGPNPLPANTTTPGAAISGIWAGAVEPPQNGLYNLFVEADTTAQVTLTLDGTAVPLSSAGGVWQNSAPVTLRAGTAYPIVLTVANVRTRLAVRWQTAGRGLEAIPASYLHPAAMLEDLRLTYTRFRKAVALAEATRLTAPELAHLAADPALRISGRGWLNRLPVTGTATGGISAGLLTALTAVLDLTRVKAALPVADERFLEVLRRPTAAPLLALTGWTQDSLTAVLTRFGVSVGELRRTAVLARVHDALHWAGVLGVPAGTLIAATTNEPAAAVVRDLQAALRARYDTAGWLDVLKPINDELRTAQRDALVAHILHRMRANPASAHIDTPEKLFEFFLMDVRMDASILTSRIRHALSSVQLFVERCLMNLEPRVSPRSINARQWEWMKRYRVWEANRKVFLYPENWLEPELRDDQSPFFREAMSELLQGDITEDRAAQAYVGYLAKLDEVAKLETCAVHYEENSEGTADDVVHVVGRTAGAKRKYLYRRREAMAWSPWERIGLDVEDNPVLPLVWNDRLFLFWLKIVLEAEDQAPPSPPNASLATVNASDVFPDRVPRTVVKAILAWSERVGGAWQPARTSDPAGPLHIGTFDRTGASAFDRSRLQLAALFWTDGAVRIIVTSQNGIGTSFFLHNPFSAPELRPSKKDPHFQPKRTLDTTTDVLKASYERGGAAHTVLNNITPDRTVEPRHPLGGDPWSPPFFYEDARHSFYVSTTERLVTVPQWNDIGIVPWYRKPTAEIPKLVLTPERIVPIGPGVPVTRQPGFGVVDPVPIRQFVTEDVYISKALGTAGTVRFNARDIGPSGSQIVVR